MNVNYMFSLIAVLVLCLVAYVGGEAEGLQFIFGVIIPYLAVVIFIVGFVRCILNWSSSPVPFKIPTTCGQHKSLPWFKQNRIDNPSTTIGVIIRMALEILCFRSLFRNTRMSFKQTATGEKISYNLEIWLWIFALAFHYSFLVVLVRHLRFFFDPVPFCITIIENLDGFFRIEFFSDIIAVGLPGIYLTGLILLAAVVFLLLRRILSPNVNYISISSDYFPLFLIIGIAVTGILMRYFVKVDIVGIKEFTMGLVKFQFNAPGDVGGIFYAHLFLVSVLMAYFPFSKLMHLGGVFLSPTRNMTTNTREKRHVNPWNYPVKVHTYAEYEDEYREKMIEAGVPVEKKE
jgi:nitrate reductase gamma subunit